MCRIISKTKKILANTQLSNLIFIIFFIFPNLLIHSFSSAIAKEKVFQIKIQNKRVINTKKTIRISEGDFVKINWQTDYPIELHLHGYDQLLKLTKNGSGTITFRAHTAGRFPVNFHSKDSHDHGNILYIEIYPN